MNATSKADGAGPARWVFGFADRRILALSRFVRRDHALPSIGRHGLQAAGCEAAHFDDELRAMAPHLAVGWAPLRPRESDSASFVMVANMALEALLELDAAAVVLGVIDLDQLDQTVAAPLGGWQRQGLARPDEPPLRALAAAALGAHGRAVLETFACAAACARLSMARSSRRRALGELGAELDARAGHRGPIAEVALALACRAREAVAIGEALADHLQRREALEDRGLAEAWRETTIAVSHRMGLTLDAVHALVGMDH